MNKWKSLPICDDCWLLLHPSGKAPVRFKELYRDKEECALCENETESGIYARALITVESEEE